MKPGARQAPFVGFVGHRAGALHLMTRLLILPQPGHFSGPVVVQATILARPIHCQKRLELHWLPESRSSSVTKYSVVHIFAITGLQGFALDDSKRSSSAWLSLSPQEEGILHVLVIHSTRKFI